MKLCLSVFSLFFCLWAATCLAEPNSTNKLPLRVMTFNIRYGTANDGLNSWDQRREQLIDVIRNFSPTLLGTQEALRFQLDELLEEFPNMSLAGVGRDDGESAGEFSAILYDRRRLQLLEHGTFWFSETPLQSGSMGWGAKLPRICTWIRCLDHFAGSEFYLYNTHWDHQSQESREKSAALLLKKIAARRNTEAPLIVTGDFNSSEDSPQFLLLLSNKTDVLVDSFRSLYPDAVQVGTFNGFRGTTAGAKIDAVLVSQEWDVKKANIVRSNKEGQYPSDHYPVTAVIQQK